MKNKEKLWKTHVEHWKQSGLTQRRYCLENDLSPSTFLRWKKRLSEITQNLTVSAKHEELVEVPLRVPHEKAIRETSIAVQTGRYRILVPSGFDADLLKSLLDLLERR